MGNLTSLLIIVEWDVIPIAWSVKSEMRMSY